MKKLSFKSLTMRIWTTFTAVILIIICSISVFYLVAFRRIDENAKVSDLKVAHDILVKNSDFKQPFNRFDEMRNLKGSNFFILNITDKKKNIIDINKRQEPPKDLIHVPVPPPHNDIPNHIENNTDIKNWMSGFVSGGNIHEKLYKKTYNHVKFIFIVSSVKYGNTGNSYLITYAPDLQDNSLLYMVFGIGMCFIAVGFLASKIIASRISKPLKELEEYTVRIAHKNWKEPIEVKSEDEIGRLAESMNSMQRELKHAEEEEKMFLQSISHDLKTPVMVIMSHADAIIDGVYIESVEKTAEIIRDEAMNLEKKIKQILYLNTLDYVLDNNSENVYIKLNELLQHIIGRFELVNSKIEWNLNINKVTVNGNIDKLQVAIENILDNALRYAKEKINISVKTENSYAVLEIYNDGPQIPEKHIGHIFDNLYKDKTGNFGLGLAITKKIIEFYNGDIKAVNRDIGVSFIIKYPI